MAKSTFRFCGSFPGMISRPSLTQWSTSITWNVKTLLNKRLPTLTLMWLLIVSLTFQPLRKTTLTNQCLTLSLLPAGKTPKRLKTLEKTLSVRYTISKWLSKNRTAGKELPKMLLLIVTHAVVAARSPLSIYLRERTVKKLTNLLSLPWPGARNTKMP